MLEPIWLERSKPVSPKISRNLGVIADNVGDNVGDVPGMGDIFESFVGSIIAAMIIASEPDAPGTPMDVD